MRLFVPLVAALLTCVVPAVGRAAEASFRVVEARLDGAGKTATVKLAWKYAGEGESFTYHDTNRTFTKIRTGKGVRFFVYDQLPGYDADVAWCRSDEPKAQGLPVGTVDMVAKGGTGMASLTFELAKAKARPGQALHLVGIWDGGHQWGCDSNRPGGHFVVPGTPGAVEAQANSRLALRGRLAARGCLVRPALLRAWPRPWSAR